MDRSLKPLIGSIFAKNDPIRDFGSFGFCHLPSCKIFLLQLLHQPLRQKILYNVKEVAKKLENATDLLVQICMIKVNKIGEDSQNWRKKYFYCRSYMKVIEFSFSFTFNNLCFQHILKEQYHEIWLLSVVKRYGELWTGANWRAWWSKIQLTS